MRKYAALHQAFIDVLREAREEAELPQEVLSAKIEEVKTFINVLEHNQHGLSATEFVAISEALDRDPVELLQTVLKACPRPARGRRKR
jgi:ribosome-binding protein aMBF1 (putative translation factor)